MALRPYSCKHSGTQLDLGAYSLGNHTRMVGGMGDLHTSKEFFKSDSPQIDDSRTFPTQRIRGHIFNLF